MYNMWCFESRVPFRGSDLEYFDKTDTCTFIGYAAIQTDYFNADLFRITSFVDPTEEDEPVDKSFCCLAYDPTSSDFLNIELQYACEELVSTNVTFAYSEANVCTVTTETGTYVDYNADSMYKITDDGQLYD